MTTSVGDQILAMLDEVYPRYFLRIEAPGCHWAEVSKQTYLIVENRWTQSRDAADCSRFSGRGVEGRVQWRHPLSEKDVISGVH